jgi:hypothetical protein
MTTLFTVVRSAAAELGLAVPGRIIPNGDLIVQQLTALTQAAGDELATYRVWKWLLREHSFTTTAVALYPLPEDCSRLVDDSVWDRSSSGPLGGPLLTQEWQALQAGSMGGGPGLQFRMLRDCVELRPQPVPLDLTVSFHYVGSWWIYPQPAVPTDVPAFKPNFTDDSDYVVFGKRLIVNAVKLKYLQAKGFDTSAAAADYQNSLDQSIAHDTGGQTINLAGGRGTTLLGVWNIPEGSW